MKNLTLLLLLGIAFPANAQTAQQDSAHRAYHLMHKKDPKQNNPYAFADSAKSKKPAKKKKTTKWNTKPPVAHKIMAQGSMTQ